MEKNPPSIGGSAVQCFGGFFPSVYSSVNHCLVNIEYTADRVFFCGDLRFEE
jgi:hypothetical protein